MKLVLTDTPLQLEENKIVGLYKKINQSNIAWVVLVVGSKHLENALLKMDMKIWANI